MIVASTSPIACGVWTNRGPRGTPLQCGRFWRRICFKCGDERLRTAADGTDEKRGRGLCHLPPSPSLRRGGTRSGNPKCNPPGAHRRDDERQTVTGFLPGWNIGAVLNGPESPDGSWLAFQPPFFVRSSRSVASTRSPDFGSVPPGAALCGDRRSARRTPSPADDRHLERGLRRWAGFRQSGDPAF
jgi:hypothetical protein